MPVGTKLNTKPSYLIYDDHDRTTDFPERQKPSGKRYAGYVKRNRPLSEYFRIMTHLFGIYESELSAGLATQAQRGVIPGSEILKNNGGVGQCDNLTLAQCYAIGQMFPKTGHMFSQEGEGDPVLVPKSDIVRTNGGETANNAQRHREYYRGITDGLPSNYWFFGNYGSLYFSYSNEFFSVDGGVENAVQSKFINMYTSQSAARAAFKQYYPDYYNMGMKWHAHLYVRYLPTNGLEHSVLHKLKVGKMAFPGRPGSLFFWPPVESVTGAAFSTNHKFRTRTTNPAGAINTFEHAVLPTETCRNVCFIGYMEVECVTLFEDPYRHGEDTNIRNGGGEFRHIDDEFFPDTGGTATFPYKPNTSAWKLYPRQPWSSLTACTLGVDLAMQAVNYLGGTHDSYTCDYASFRLNGGAWTNRRGDGQDVLYQRAADTTTNGIRISGAKPLCLLYRSVAIPGRVVVAFMDPDGPFGGYRQLEVQIDGITYDLGLYEARDLHAVCFELSPSI